METLLLSAIAILLAAFLWRLNLLTRDSISSYLAFLPLGCVLLSLSSSTIASLVWHSILEPQRISGHEGREAPKRSLHFNIGTEDKSKASISNHTIQTDIRGPDSHRESQGAEDPFKSSEERQQKDIRSPNEIFETASSDAKLKAENSKILVRCDPSDLPCIIFKGPSQGNRIAFVFDDGPHPLRTPRLLDLLKEKGVKASFAVLASNVKRYPEITKRIVEENHALVIHGESHRSFVELDGTGELEGEIARSLSLIHDVAGVTPKYVRPPYGDITESLATKIRDRWGLTTLMWNVDPEDYRVKDSEKIFEHLSIRTASGSINVLHDHVAASLEATRMFIDAHPHFELVAIDELLSISRSLDPEQSPKKSTRKLPFQVVPSGAPPLTQRDEKQLKANPARAASQVELQISDSL